MADEATVTYYAIVDDFSSRDRPAGVLRRIRDERGRRDEGFGRDLKWGRTALLLEYERGDTTNRFYPTVTRPSSAPAAPLAPAIWTEGSGHASARAWASARCGASPLTRGAVGPFPPRYSINTI